MDLSLLQKTLDSLSFPPFRYRQIVKNYFSGRYSSFDQMTDISLDLRKALFEKVPFSSIKSADIFKDDQTEKAVLELQDGQKIESVLMNYDEWLTVCVSSQVGCPLACKFCATGKMGLIRNLTPDEIVDQVLFWNQKLFPKYVGRIVLMGMGEPFLNWDNVIEALKIINSETGLNIGARKISISTAGVVDKIIEFADLKMQYNLAVSLHSAIQETRESIMPIAQKYSLDQLKDACDYYTRRTNRQIFFEYALMKDINDTPDELTAIIKFIRSNRLFYLNLIPLNPVAGGMTPSTQKSFDNFVQVLEKTKVNYSIRRSFGQSVNAACGQLATNSR
jgi:23S rRNA (adenine2503-C2)-methyltransferase